MPLVVLVIFLYYSPALPFLIFLLGIGIIGILEIREMAKEGRKIYPKSNILSHIFGIYVCISLTFYYFLKFSNNGGFYFLLIIIVAGTFDVTAYLIGKEFGKRKIVPKISPGKTWEGTIGGGICSITSIIIVCIITKTIFQGNFWNTFSAALSIPPLAFFGDLLESFYKRKMGVKDSGRILPGHGGLLDRIDSLLLPVWGIITLKALSIIR